MDSKEFGLVFIHKLLGLDHLHYGYWEPGDQVGLGGLIKAQEKYSALLMATIEEYAGREEGEEKPCQLLDVGCGTGTTLCRLLEQDYAVDGVSPSTYLYAIVNEKLAALRDVKEDVHAQIFHCDFEDLPLESLQQKYDLVFFSESFQYLCLADAYPVLNHILKPTGKILICDFFKRDAGVDKALFGGGYPLSLFYADLPKQGWHILLDKDITENMSPSIDLLERLMSQRAIPALGILDEFLTAGYPFAYKALRLALRPQLRKLQKKYFAGNRTKINFEKHKSYRLLVLERIGLES